MSNRCPTCGGIVGCFGPFKSLDELYPVHPPTTPAKVAGDERDEEIAALKKTARTMLGDIEVLNWEEADDDKIAELQQKWWGYKADAERYRWMKANCFYAQSAQRPQPNVYIEVFVGLDKQGRRCMMYPNHTQMVGAPNLDTAIDAAIAAKESK